MMLSKYQDLFPRRLPRLSQRDKQVEINKTLADNLVLLATYSNRMLVDQIRRDLAEVLSK